MNIVFTIRARQTLNDVADFVDAINTEGAGGRWQSRIVEFIADYAQPNVTYSLCNNEQFAAKGFSCITFINWVIVFKIEDEEFVVYQIVRGSTLP